MPEPDDWNDVDVPGELVPPPAPPPTPEEPPQTEKPWWERLADMAGNAMQALDYDVRVRAPETAARVLMPHEGDTGWQEAIRRHFWPTAPTVPAGATSEEAARIRNEWWQRESAPYEIKSVQVGPWEVNPADVLRGTIERLPSPTKLALVGPSITEWFGLPEPTKVAAEALVPPEVTLNPVLAWKGLEELPFSVTGALSLIPGGAIAKGLQRVAPALRELPGVEQLIRQSAQSIVRNEPNVARAAIGEMMTTAAESKLPGISIRGEWERVASGQGLSPDLLERLGPQARQWWERVGDTVARAVRPILEAEGAADDLSKAGNVLRAKLAGKEAAIAAATDPSIKSGERLAATIMSNLDDMHLRPNDVAEAVVKWAQEDVIRTLQEAGRLPKATFFRPTTGNKVVDALLDVVFMPPGSVTRRLLQESFLGTLGFVSQQVLEPISRGLATWVNPYVGFGSRARQFARQDLPRIIGKEEAERMLDLARQRVRATDPNITGMALERAAERDLLRSHMPEYLSHEWAMTYSERYKGHPFITVGYEGGSKGAIAIREAEQAPILGPYTRHVRAIASLFDSTMRGNAYYKGFIEYMRQQLAKPKAPLLGKAMAESVEQLAREYGISALEKERMLHIITTRPPEQAIAELRLWGSGAWNPILEDVTPAASIVAEVAPEVLTAFRTEVNKIVARNLPLEETKELVRIAARKAELLAGVHELGLPPKAVKQVSRAIDQSAKLETRLAELAAKREARIAAAQARAEALTAQIRAAIQREGAKGKRVVGEKRATQANISAELQELAAVQQEATNASVEAVAQMRTLSEGVLKELTQFLQKELDDIMDMPWGVMRQEDLRGWAWLQSNIRDAIRPVYEDGLTQLGNTLKRINPGASELVDRYIAARKDYFNNLAATWLEHTTAWDRLGIDMAPDAETKKALIERFRQEASTRWRTWHESIAPAHHAELAQLERDIASAGRKVVQPKRPPPEELSRAAPTAPAPETPKPPPTSAPTQAAPSVPSAGEQVQPPAVDFKRMSDREIVDGLELPRGSALDEKNMAEAVRIMAEAAESAQPAQMQVTSTGRTALEQGGLLTTNVPSLASSTLTPVESFSMARTAVRTMRDRLLADIEAGLTGGQRAAARAAEELKTLLQNASPSETKDFARLLNEGQEAGARYADYVGGNYAITGDLVDALRNGPAWFAYFPIQAMQFWGGQLLEKPWLSQVARHYLDLTERTWPEGTPERMRKRGLINLERLHPSLQGWGLNPLALMSPWRWANPAPLYTDPEGGALSMVSDTIQRQTGMSLAPNYTYGLLLISKALKHMGQPALFEQEVRSIIPQLDWIRAGTAMLGLRNGKGIDLEAALGWKQFMYGRDTSRFHEYAVRKELATMETRGEKPNREIAEQNVAARELLSMMIMGLRFGNPEEREFQAAKVAMNAAQSAAEREAIRRSKPFMTAWYEAGKVFQSPEQIEKEARINEAWARLQAIKETREETIKLLREKAPGSPTLRKLKRDQAEEIAKWKRDYPDVANNQPSALELLSLRAINAKYNDKIAAIAKSKGIAAADDPTYQRLVRERAQEIAALKEKHPSMSTAAAYMNGEEYEALVKDLTVYRKLEEWSKLLKDTEKLPKEQRQAERDNWWKANPDVAEWTRSRQTDAEKDYSDFWDMFVNIPRASGLRSQVFQAFLPWLLSKGYEQQQPPRPAPASAEEDIERRMTTINTLRDQLRMLQAARPGDPRVRTLNDMIRWEYTMLQAAHPREAQEAGLDDPSLIKDILQRAMDRFPQIMTQSLVEQIEFDQRMRKKHQEFGQLYERYKGNSDAYTEARAKFLTDNPDYAEWRAANRSEAQREADRLWEGYYAAEKGPARRQYLREHADEFAALGYELGQGYNRGFAASGATGTGATPENRAYLVARWTEYETLKTEAEKDAWMRDNLADLMAHGYKPQPRTIARYSPEAVAMRDQERANKAALDEMWSKYYGIHDNKTRAEWLRQNLDRMITLGWRPTARQIGAIRNGLGLSGTQAQPTVPRITVPYMPVIRRGGGGGRPRQRVQQVGQLAAPRMTVMDWFRRRRVSRRRTA